MKKATRERFDDHPGEEEQTMTRTVLGLIVGAVLQSGCAPEADSATAGDGQGSESTGADLGNGDASGSAGDEDSSAPAEDGVTDIIVAPGDNEAPDDVPPEDCEPKTIGLLRDFRSVSSVGEPEYGDESLLNVCPVYGDFEAKCIAGNVPPDLPFIADFCWQIDVPYLGQPEEGIPAMTLGPDQKPVLADPTRDYETVRSAETFDAWYRDDPNCNMTYEYELPMMVSPTSGNLVFDSSAFFPLDGLGYHAEDAEWHNFHFTFELHMEFTYKEGDVFSFSGDDDLFVYINNQLVIDLGGAHASMDDSVNLDELGLVPGETYPIDFFHAERAKGESNFHIETSLTFSNCDPIIVR